MKELIHNIVEKNFEDANKVLKEHLDQIVERKKHEMYKMVAAKSFDQHLNEAIVQEDGYVHTAPGERILPSVWRARRGLTEENLEVDNSKVELALAKAKMLLQPELDTEAPNVDRNKVKAMPSGHRGRRDKPNIVDRGPREDEWESGQLKEGKMKEIDTARQEAKRLKKETVLVTHRVGKNHPKHGIVERIPKNDYNPEIHRLAV